MPACDACKDEGEHAGEIPCTHTQEQTTQCHQISKGPYNMKVLDTISAP